VGSRIDDLSARSSFNRAVVQRHDKTPRRRNSFAPSGLFDRSTLSRGLRPWLLSYAASRLGWNAASINTAAAIIKRRAAETLSPLRGYLIVQRSPGACAPGYCLTPLRGWDGTPRQSTPPQWLSRLAVRSGSARPPSAAKRRKKVGIDKRKALKGRKKRLRAQTAAI